MNVNDPEVKALSKDMEEKILQAASRVFVLKGKAGTSMQDIAEEAGINRTLLNYYFRSKENLFDQVFSSVFSKFVPEILRTFSADIPIEERLGNFIDYYFKMLIENPVVPLFILQELTTSPNRLIECLKSGGVDSSIVIKALEAEMDKGTLKRTDPREIIVNLMSLIIFPFTARKIIEEMIFSGDREAFNSFILKRKESLKSSFIQFLKT